MQVATSVLSSASCDVVIMLHTKNDPPQSEWDEHYVLIRQLKEKNKGDVSRIRTFVVSDGGAPNVKQRGEIHQQIYGRPTKLALVTHTLSHPLKRGIATAISWINPSFHAFTPREYISALAHLEVTLLADKIFERLAELQKTMPPNATLDLLVRARGAPELAAKSA